MSHLQSFQSTWYSLTGMKPKNLSDYTPLFRRQLEALCQRFHLIAFKRWDVLRSDNFWMHYTHKEHHYYATIVELSWQQTSHQIGNGASRMDLSLHIALQWARASTVQEAQKLHQPQQATMIPKSTQQFTMHCHGQDYPEAAPLIYLHDFVSSGGEDHDHALNVVQGGKLCTLGAASDWLQPNQTLVQAIEAIVFWGITHFQRLPEVNRKWQSK